MNTTNAIKLSQCFSFISNVNQVRAISHTNWHCSILFSIPDNPSTGNLTAEYFAAAHQFLLWQLF